MVTVLYIVLIVYDTFLSIVMSFRCLIVNLFPVIDIYSLMKLRLVIALIGLNNSKGKCSMVQI